jgi:hypothetical protein
MPNNNCPEYDRLETEVDENLSQLKELTTLQLEIFRSKNYNRFMRLDKELELAVGEKERSIGAFKEHVKQHQCQPVPDTKFTESK